MSNIFTDEEIIKEVHKGVTLKQAARNLGMGYRTIQRRWKKIKSKRSENYQTSSLEKKVADLSKELKLAKFDSMTVEKIRKFVFGLKEQRVEPPNWCLKTNEKNKSNKSIGVPCLMMSDIHFGEVVDPNQIMGYNEYNMEIAERRIFEVVDRTIDLLFNHMKSPNYEGIVLTLMGDLISGDIHEELTATNEQPIMYATAKLIKILIKVIEILADKFKNVFVVVSAGNHSRTTLKPVNKNISYTSFDWLIGTQLETYFQKDKRIQFLVSDGADCQFKIYNTIFRQTHGQQFFSSGQGFVGALGPIVRGALQKRIASIGCKNEYDVLLLAHFHKICNLGGKVFCNGSIKGYDEYAYNRNMDPEAPMQTLFIVNEKRGITFTFNIQAESPQNYPKKTSWISIEG